MKIENGIIALLGLICIAIIVWFVMSDRSPMIPKSNYNETLLITSQTGDFEIRLHEASYWFNGKVGDSIKIGDRIRTHSESEVVMRISDNSALIANGPFDLRVARNSTREPMSVVVEKGTISLLMENADPFDTVFLSSPEGTFALDPAQISSQKIHVELNNEGGNLSVRLINGAGRWVEGSSSVQLESGEILTRNTGDGELRKSSI